MKTDNEIIRANAMYLIRRSRMAGDMVTVERAARALNAFAQGERLAKLLTPGGIEHAS